VLAAWVFLLTLQAAVLDTTATGKHMAVCCLQVLLGVVLLAIRAFTNPST
jgi:hypothetical protein